MTTTLFVSYRRDDSAPYAGRIRDHLITEFEVFMDVDSVPLGRKFRHILREAVEKCHVLLPIIGPRWLDKAAELPEDIKELVDYNGLFVRHESFDSDINKLIRHIKALDLPFRWAASHHDRYDTIGIVEPGQFVVVLAQPILRGTEVVRKGRVTRKRE
jgi:TIR domain